MTNRGTSKIHWSSLIYLRSYQLSISRRKTKEDIRVDGSCPLQRGPLEHVQASPAPCTASVHSVLLTPEAEMPPGGGKSAKGSLVIAILEATT